jgi:hypothetical protein
LARGFTPGLFQGGFVRSPKWFRWAGFPPKYSEPAAGARDSRDPGELADAGSSAETGFKAR